MLRSGTYRLSAAALRFMDDAAASGNQIVLSSISLAEIVYLVEKGRLPEAAYQDLIEALGDPEYLIEEAPLNAEIVDIMRTVPRAEVPDMPDRIVAATALYFKVPVISREARIMRRTSTLLGSQLFCSSAIHRSPPRMRWLFGGRPMLRTPSLPRPSQGHRLSSPS